MRCELKTLQTLLSMIRSIPKPYQHGKDIIQRESLGIGIGTDEQQLHKTSQLN